MNHYLEALGLGPGVSEADIKRAYRRLAKQYHPDINQDPDAQRRFVEITEAYNFLLEVGAKPHHENVNYNYDPLAQEYAERRKKARAYAREKRRQEAEDRWKALHTLYSYTDYLVGLMLLLNVLMLVDYLLPGNSQVEKVTKLSYSYESPDQQGQNLIYRHGTIFFEEHSIRVSQEISDQWKNLEPVGNVHTSLILDIVLKAEVVLNNVQIVVLPAFSVYRFFFFIIPVVLLLGTFYFRWPKLSENKIGLVGILLILFVIQTMVFFLS